MGIELPRELADVAAQTGVVWPEADEEAMARQAQAWRDTATSMSTLATDADITARAALTTVSGAAAQAATAEWRTFVEPDTGHLTAAVRDANAAADRLEHAANQIGAAKVEIVRSLVGLAQNQDAAGAAAQAGHPYALAGVDTAVRGTTANLAHLETQLIAAVRPGSGVDMAALQPLVNPNPGQHLQPAALLAHPTEAVAQLPAVVAEATNLAHVPPVADLPQQAGPTTGATDLVRPGAGPLPDVADVARPGGTPLLDPASVVRPGADPDALLPSGGHVPPAHSVDGLPNPHLPDPELTGPVPADQFPGDAPTPPTGQTVQAGFAGGFEQSAAPAPANLPPASTAPPLANPGAPAPAFSGTPGAPGPFSAAPPPAAPPAAHPPAAAPARPAPPAAPLPPAPATHSAPPDRQPEPRKPMAGPPGAPPPARGERNEALAAFWLHMFPIGHLPVASYRPARQAPPPPEELDYAAGLRFEPADHPHFASIDTHPRAAALHTAIKIREAARKSAEAAPIPLPQDYAPPPGAGYPPVPPAHPAEAVAAGYPPADPPPAYPSPAAYAPSGPSSAPGSPVVPAVFGGSGGDGPPAGYVPSGPSSAPVNPAVPGDGLAAYSPQRGYPPPLPDGSSGVPPAGPAAGPAATAAQASAPVFPVDDGQPDLRPVTPSAGLTADHPTVQALLDNHDPLGGGHERDWDRRYLVRLGSVTAHGISPEGVEYNWPISEQYPEGGSAPGEPEVLDADTVIDRFGTPHGRVFAADRTPFAQRSLPPAHKDTSYRRYRVTKPLPVWRAVSAPWFGQPGGGVRYRTTHSAVELVALGYLEEIA